MHASWTSSSHGVRWAVALERDRLLPGRLVPLTIEVTAEDAVDGRALVAAFVATEWWQHEETTTDAQGHPSTRIETERRELLREPVLCSGPLTLAAGETRHFDVPMPVPPLGPASLDATVAGVSWALETKLDRPGLPDSRLEAAVRVGQPIALLRAGVVDVGQFALFPAADAGDPGLTASIALDPMPIVAGQPFRGTIHLRSAAARTVQEIRAEVRVHVKATVPSGLSEVLTPWRAIVVGPTEVEGDVELAFESAFPDVDVPTIELPHGRAEASFHLILATAWAPDPHLVRDITIATTSEL